MKLLIVDSEFNELKVLERIFRRRGHQADVAMCTSCAMEKVKENRYDAILTDLSLSGDVDAIGLLERIKENRPETSIIVMTRRGSDSNTFRARQVGAVDYVEKPFDVDELVRKILSL